LWLLSAARNRPSTVVIPLQFGRAEPFSDGLAAVCVGKCIGFNNTKDWEGKWGFIDKTGKFVITPQFDSTYRFEHGLSAVVIGTGDNAKNGYVDRTGKYIWNPTN